LALGFDSRYNLHHGAGDEAFDHEWHHAAAMGEDPGNIGIPRGGSAEDQAGNGAGGVCPYSTTVSVTSFTMFRQQLPSMG
jgi:hypothetical protein